MNKSEKVGRPSRSVNKKVPKEKLENIKPLPTFSEETRPTKEKIILKESIKKNIKKSKKDEK